MAAPCLSFRPAPQWRRPAALPAPRAMAAPRGPLPTVAGHGGAWTGTSGPSGSVASSTSGLLRRSPHFSGNSGKCGRASAQRRARARGHTLRHRLWLVARAHPSFPAAPPPHVPLEGRPGAPPPPALRMRSPPRRTLARARARSRPEGAFPQSRVPVRVTRTRPLAEAQDPGTGIFTRAPLRCPRCGQESAVRLVPGVSVPGPGSGPAASTERPWPN